MNGFLADLVVAAHLAYIAFVILGALVVLRWPKAAWIHVPAAAWAVVNELCGLVCPLTPLEYALRAGSDGPPVDTGGPGFVERFILPVLYPSALTREVQIVLGSFVLGVNIVLYAWAWKRSVRAPGTPSN